MKLTRWVLFTLILLYPPRLRRRDGADVLLLFEEMAESAARRHGRLGFAGFSARTALDLVRTAATSWFELLGGRGRGPLQPDQPHKKRRPTMTALQHDIACAWRSLWRRPALTATAVITLGLGIGASVAMFSVVYGVLLRPLGLEQPERLANIRQQHAGDSRDASNLSPRELLTLRESLEHAEDVAGAFLESVTLTAGGVYRGETLELSNAVVVSNNFFDLLGVRPIEGRTFDQDDAPTGSGRGTSVILSDRLFASLLGSDRSLIGSDLVLDGVPATLIGVVSSVVPAPLTGADAWLAHGMDISDRTLNRRVMTVARMTPDSDLAELDQELATLYSNLGEEQPHLRLWTASASPFREDLLGSVRSGLWIAFGGVVLLLLLASANFANLMMARLSARQSDLSTRACLGATRGALFRQLAVESTILSLLAGAFGMLAAAASHQYLVALSGSMLPRTSDVRLDLPVLLFALLLSLGCGLVFGNAPAALGVAGTLRPSAQGLRAGSSAGRRLRASLATLQVALAVILVSAALLLVHSFRSLANADPGIDLDRVAMARIYLDDERYDTLAKQRVYFDGLRERIQALPTVTGVAITSSLPMDPDAIDFDLPYSRPDRPQPDRDDPPQAYYRAASPGYFEALGIELRAGRTFLPNDVDGSPVTVINETLARIAWPDGDALGSLLRLGFAGTTDYEIVGIIADSSFSTLGAPAKPEMYFPSQRVSFGGGTAVVRTTGDPAQLLPSLRAAVLAQDPNQPANALATFERLAAATVAAEKFYSRLAGFVGALALALAVAGVYALIAYWVGSSRFELALRQAVGASRGRIVGLVLSKALRLAGVGSLLGLAGSILLLNNLQSILYQTAPLDPRALTLAVLALISTALLAGLIPARSALRTEVAKILQG